MAAEIKKVQKIRNIRENTVDDLETGIQTVPGACRPGSIEQQLDMCETGPLKGDEILHRHGMKVRTNPHPTLNDELMETNFNIDMSEEGREGDEESGDEHSLGLQGEEANELQQDDHPGNSNAGLPGEMTNKATRLDPSKRGYRRRAG